MRRAVTVAALAAFAALAAVQLPAARAAQPLDPENPPAPTSRQLERSVTVFDPARSVLRYDLDRSVEPLKQRLTRYDVLREDADPYRWQTEPVSTEVRNGQVLEAVYVFAAPPEEVRTVDLGFRMAWPQFLDVPVQR